MPFSSVSVVDFGQINVYWDDPSLWLNNCSKSETETLKQPLQV